MGGNHVEYNATLWPNLQDCKISNRVEIPKLDPSVATVKFYESDAIDQHYNLQYLVDLI